jgi:periplasmic copper chaperone A
MFTTPSLRRTATRVALGLSAAGAFVVAAPMAAQAHVTVQPGSTEGGDFSVIALRVPNERDDASTTRVRVLLPEDQPLGSVQTTATPGWRITTGTRKLAQPIEMFGAKVDQVVSEVTWTATNGGVRPGQFQDFDLSLGQLPKTGDLVFNAIQTYSSGEQVRWNEVSADGSAEPEHPAPTLHLTAAQSEDSSTTEDTSAQAPETSSETRNVSATTDSDSNAVLPTVLSGAALLVALGAVGLAWRRGRS